MEWKTNCCEFKDQKNIVVKNKKENPNEFGGKLRFNNPKSFFCLDVNVTCQLKPKKGSFKSCDSLLLVFNTKDKEKLKTVESESISQKHFIEFKSGDLSNSIKQIASTVKILGFKKRLNFGYIVRNPKKKLYTQSMNYFKKHSYAYKNQIIFEILKSNEIIKLN